MAHGLEQIPIGSNEDCYPDCFVIVAFAIGMRLPRAESMLLCTYFWMTTHILTLCVLPDFDDLTRPGTGALFDFGLLQSYL